MLSTTLPFASSVFTAIIAVVAIIATRRSNQETLVSTLRQRMWEKQVEAYRQILREVKRFDPREITPHMLINKGKDGNPVPIPTPLDTAEWLEFTALVEAVSSEEVRYLFNIWERSIAGWTWVMCKVIAHTRSDSEYLTKAKEELEECYKAIFTAQEMLRQHIRAELRFEHPIVPQIEYKAPEGFFGAIVMIKAFIPEQPRYPIKDVPRITEYKPEDYGDQFTVQL